LSLYINAYNITSYGAFLNATWSGYLPDQFQGYTAVIECNGSQVASLQYSSATSLSGTISGLAQGYTYTATVILWHKNGTESAQTTFTTYAPPPIIPGIPSITSTSSSGYDGTIYFNKGVNTEYVVIEFSSGNGLYLEMNQFSGSPAYHTFPDLGVVYYVRAYGISSDGNISGWSGYSTVRTGTNRPFNWAWTSSIYSGREMDTVQVRDNVYHAYVITAYEWNSFTSAINAFLTYKLMTSGDFTTVSMETNFTLTILSQAVNNINRMLSSNFLSYSTDITAKIFLDMRDRLNSIT
jgi:hypothetical protein